MPQWLTPGLVGEKELTTGPGTGNELQLEAWGRVSATTNNRDTRAPYGRNRLVARGS